MKTLQSFRSEMDREFVTSTLRRINSCPSASNQSNESYFILVWPSVTDRVCDQSKAFEPEYLIDKRISQLNNIKVLVVTNQRKTRILRSKHCLPGNANQPITLKLKKVKRLNSQLSAAITSTATLEWSAKKQVKEDILLRNMKCIPLMCGYWN